MPPKAAAPDAEGVTLTGRNVEVLRKLLCSLDVKINGTDFGRLIGLTSPHNGGTVLKNAVAPLGVAVKDGSFHELNEGAATAATTATTSVTASTAKDGAATKRKRGGKKEGGGATKKSTKSAATAAEDVEEGTDDAEGTETTD